MLKKHNLNLKDSKTLDQDQMELTFVLNMTATAKNVVSSSVDVTF